MIRRSLLRWLPIAALAATCAMAMSSPAAQASPVVGCAELHPQPAYCNVNDFDYGTAEPRHVGWVYLNLNYCPPGRACAAMYQVSMPAWRWTGYRWTQASLDGGWVYVYPYSGAWRWAWTQKSGWVAVNGGRFELR